MASYCDFETKLGSKSYLNVLYLYYTVLYWRQLVFASSCGTGSSWQGYSDPVLRLNARTVPHGGDARLLNAAQKKNSKKNLVYWGPREREPHAGARLATFVGGFFIISESGVLVAPVAGLVERQ